MTDLTLHSTEEHAPGAPQVIKRKVGFENDSFASVFLSSLHHHSQSTTKNKRGAVTNIEHGASLPTVSSMNNKGSTWTEQCLLMWSKFLIRLQPRKNASVWTTDGTLAVRPRWPSDHTGHLRVTSALTVCSWLAKTNHGLVESG